MDTISKGNRKGAIPRIFQGGQDALKPFKVCSVPVLFKGEADLSLGVLRTSGGNSCELSKIQTLRRLRSWL